MKSKNAVSPGLRITQIIRERRLLQQRVQKVSGVRLLRQKDNCAKDDINSVSLSHTPATRCRMWSYKLQQEKERV